MKSFKLEKPRGDADVTHEALMWLLVFAVVIAPLLFVVYWIVG